MTKGITVEEARELLRCRGPEALELFARAGAERLRSRGDRVDPCAIVNAKSGNCGQNCAFCAQSARSTAAIETYPLRSRPQLLDAARQAADAGASRFSLVTSGRAVRRQEEIERLASVIEEISKSLPLSPCASLGLLDQETLRRFRDVGLERYHHNLETAESFWTSVCTSRSWRASLKTIEAAASLDMELCVGGIFGLGESLDQRVELLQSIRELETASAPLNFLHPIAGTPLADQRDLTPLDCLKIIAVARLMMPEREIRVCGGREHNLRDLQSWVLLAGADGIMVGGYLTTGGRTIADDLQMIRDAGLSLRSNDESTASDDR